VKNIRVILISGLSGSGKTTAIIKMALNMTNNIRTCIPFFMILSLFPQLKKHPEKQGHGALYERVFSGRPVHRIRVAVHEKRYNKDCYGADDKYHEPVQHVARYALFGFHVGILTKTSGISQKSLSTTKNFIP
jgi:hypothetical protein